MARDPGGRVIKELQEHHVEVIETVDKVEQPRLLDGFQPAGTANRDVAAARRSRFAGLDVSCAERDALAIAARNSSDPRSALISSTSA
ncbi:hypothetical protein [Leifsonia aquatica]|uniref:hypothetical protein n=1 Tax=Leifsonia aquatica TaxID=144185 RepID=UPI00381D2BA7